MMPWPAYSLPARGVRSVTCLISHAQRARVAPVRQSETAPLAHDTFNLIPGRTKKARGAHASCRQTVSGQR